jgi:hypothetical protein
LNIFDKKSIPLPKISVLLLTFLCLSACVIHVGVPKFIGAETIDEPDNSATTNNSSYSQEQQIEKSLYPGSRLTYSKSSGDEVTLNNGRIFKKIGSTRG